MKAIAESCGTSTATIERSYGCYFPKDLDGGVKALGSPTRGGAKTVTSTVTSVARAVGDGLTGAIDQRKTKWSHWESNICHEDPPETEQSPANPLESRVSDDSDDDQRDGKKRQE